MKRGKKLLLLLLALAVISVSAWGITELTAQKDTPTSANSGETVFSLDADTLTALSWIYEENAFAFENTENGWVYSQDTAYPLDASYIEDILTELTEVTASKVIAEPGDLTQFGLTEPVCSVTVNEASTLLLGSETTMGGARYASTGDGKVYLVDSGLLDCFTYDLYDMVKYEDIPDLSAITGLTLTTETETLELVCQENSGLAYSDHYTWFRVDGSSDTPVDMEAMEDLLSILAGLEWAGCADYQAQSDTLAAYGLDTPAATYELQYTATVDNQEVSGVFTVELGDSADESCCYARLAGSSLIYLIDADVSTALISVSSQSLLVDDVLMLDMDTVDSVDVTLDGMLYRMEKTVKTSTDEDGDTTEETVWMLDGEQIAIESVLESLTGLTGENTGEDITPERSAEISFAFHRNTDTYAEIGLIFYQYDGTNCLVSLNGETKLLAARSHVVDIIEAINSLVLG